MALSANALHHRTLLFELNKPVIISADQFDEGWPYVDSVYTKLALEMLQCNGTMRVQKYECRLRKSSKPRTARVAAEARPSSGEIVVYVISIYAMYASKPLGLSMAQQLQLNALISIPILTILRRASG